MGSFGYHSLSRIESPNTIPAQICSSPAGCAVDATTRVPQGTKYPLPPTPPVPPPVGASQILTWAQILLVRSRQQQLQRFAIGTNASPEQGFATATIRGQKSRHELRPDNCSGPRTSRNRHASRDDRCSKGLGTICANAPKRARPASPRITNCLSAAPPVGIRKLAAGWQLNAIATAERLSFTPQIGANRSGDLNTRNPGQALDPFVTGPVLLKKQSQWFDPAAFSPTVPTWEHRTRTARLQTVDVSVIKNIHRSLNES